MTQAAWSAPNPTLKNIRHFAAADKVRVVFDVSSPVKYNVSQQNDFLHLTIDLYNVGVKSGLSRQSINHPAVSGVSVAPGAKQAQIVIDCRLPVDYKVFQLSKPDRVVVDIFPVKEKKTIENIAPGIRYTTWFKYGQAGPLKMHILEIDPQAGYSLEPALIKQNLLGIDVLSQVMLRSDAVAAVNASYFAPNGDIIGLLKLNDEIISSTSIARTALGITADGKIFIDQVSYKGEVELPDRRKVQLTGVNESRGENGLVLYNRFHGATTKTNSYGKEYTILGGRVAEIQNGNASIPIDGFVLSAHGEAAKQLADLKLGDTVIVYQSLGPVWDQIPNVLGAGPMLVKQGNVFLTTKLEQFGSDVAGGRAPRTAVASTKDGRILLVVVDGRQSLSKGMSLLELALFLRELGAYDAMNLDGGGSSEMIIKGRIVNKPSDGKERRIGSALLVVPSRLAI